MNEISTGGILYLHNKGYSNDTESDKLAHLNTILTQIERVLNVDFNCTVKQSAKPTFTLKGGLTKVPFQIIQHEPVEKIGFNK